MRSIEMILMTKSSKYGRYCVAGFDCADGKWVRLISDDKETHGALDDEMLYDASAGRCAGVLDRVQVEISRDMRARVQVENVLVEGCGKIRILGKAKLKDALALHPCEKRDGIFRSHYHIVQVDVNELGHSLELIAVKNLRCYTMTGASGRPKYKVDFEYGGWRYEQFAMTDPVYYDMRERRIGEAVLAVSISDDEWSWANGHYIYVAAIFARNACRWKIFPAVNGGKAALAAGLAAALIGIGVWLGGMGWVYVEPYSGARYHRSEKCEEIINGQSLRRIPAAVGKVMFRPCGGCGESR